MTKIKYFLLSLIILIVLGIGTLEYLVTRDQSTKTRANYNSQTKYVYRQIDYFSYKGKDGKNALEILKNKTKVEQNSTGLVVSINGRMAYSAKKEYWSFYVNGKTAEVGPADYNTKNGDLIEWKIEKY